MFETFSIASLVDTARTYLAFRAGEVQLGARDTCILILALSGALVSALNLSRIARREDFQERLDALRGTALTPAVPTRPQRSPWYHRLGTAIAITPIIGTTEQRVLLSALAAAGIRGHGRLASLLAAKGCSAVAFLMAGWLLLEWRGFFADSTTMQLVMLAAAVFLGWRMPDVVLSRLAAGRQRRLEQGLPDALDLLVFCAEAGLSLDQAIEQVARDLRSSSPDVAGEFAAAAAEMRVLPDRSKALENLAQRAGLASLRSIVATLNQSIRFGTPLSDSLRVLAAEMRTERLARYEERAARLPVLLALPLMAFILPSMMIVIGTPLILRMIDFLQQAVAGGSGVGGKLIGVP
jgi:tight adherence protein C